MPTLDCLYWISATDSVLQSRARRKHLLNATQRYYGKCLNIFSMALFISFSFLELFVDNVPWEIPRQIIRFPFASYISTTSVPVSNVSGVISAMPPPHRQPPVPHALYAVCCFIPPLATTMRSGFWDS